MKTKKSNRKELPIMMKKNENRPEEERKKEKKLTEEELKKVNGGNFENFPRTNDKQYTDDVTDRA